MFRALAALLSAAALSMLVLLGSCASKSPCEQAFEFTHACPDFECEGDGCGDEFEGPCSPGVACISNCILDTGKCLSRLSHAESAALDKCLASCPPS